MKADTLITIGIIAALSFGGFALVKKLQNTEFSGFDLFKNTGLSNPFNQGVTTREVSPEGLVTTSTKYDPSFSSRVVLDPQTEQIKKAIWSGQPLSVTKDGTTTKFGGSLFLQNLAELRAQGKSTALGDIATSSGITQKVKDNIKKNQLLQDPKIKKSSSNTKIGSKVKEGKKDPFAGLKLSKSGLFVRK